MPDFFDILETRRTVRSYTTESVSRKDLQELIDYAILAPSGMNQQPWRFTVITDRQVITRLNGLIVAILHSPQYAGLLQNEGLRQALSDPAFDIFYGAPAVIAISADPTAPSAAIDCQLAAENLFLAAHAKGLGTCYMGFLMFGRDDPEVRSLLRIDDGHQLMAATIVGHPDVRPEGRPNRDPAPVEWVTE